MISAGAFLLLMAGGYALAYRSFPFAYFNRGDTGYHIYINSAVYGGALFAVVFALLRTTPEGFIAAAALDLLGMAGDEVADETAAIWIAFAVAVIFCAGGRLLFFLINGVSPLREGIIHPLLIAADERNAVFLKAEGADKPLLIDLKNGKVYVGYLGTLPNPLRTPRHLKILPAMSGYRESESKRIELTENYPKTSGDSADSAIMLREDEVVSLRLFDANRFDAPAP